VNSGSSVSGMISGSSASRLFQGRGKVGSRTDGPRI
jgi:hypothetical protein